MFFKTDTTSLQKFAKPGSSAIFGLFKGLHAPFDTNTTDCEYPQYSPIRGIDNQLIKNLRAHGHYGPKDKGLPRPNWEGKDKTTFPQDWTASFLEFIAPSHIGFLFDSVPSTPWHKWLKPKNIALIFNAISSAHFYENSKEAILLLAYCFSPEVNFNKLEEDEKKRLQHNQKGPKYGAYSELKALSWPSKELPFAEILYEALKETRGIGALKLGYPSFIVEQILLTYMWERKNSKMDLKPFYDNLSMKIIHPSDTLNIIWEGEESYYTQDHYFKTKQPHNEKTHTSLETQKLLQLGYSYFEDKYPPELSYGVSTLKIDGKWENYSDCGEILLLNYFCVALYNFDTKQFDVEKLQLLAKFGFKINDKLIAFFQDIYTSPLCDFTPKIRNSWAAVLADLNKDCTDPIHYLKNKCCIAPGMENMSNVIKALLQPPSNYHYAFDEFLEPLNLKFYGTYDCWRHEKITDDNDNVRLIFSKGSDKIFEMHFQKEHFDYNRNERSKNLPYNCHYPNKFDELPDTLSERSFSEILFSGNLESIEGKCHAIYKIFWYKSKFNYNNFDYLIHKWIEPSGHNFAGWEDFHTNCALLKTLLEDCNVSTEFIIERNIPVLTAHMVLMEVNEHKVESVKNILKKDLELFNKQGRPAHHHDFAKMGRVLAPTIAKATGEYLNTLKLAKADDYLREISGVSLLHLACYAGSKMVFDLLNSKDKRISNLMHEKSKDGYTPMDYASISYKYATSPSGQLLELDSNPNAQKYVELCSFQGFFKDQWRDHNARSGAPDQIIGLSYQRRHNPL